MGIRTIFATNVDVELQLWKEEIVEPFACDKFVGIITVYRITHCANTLLVGLGTLAAGRQVRPSLYSSGGYRTLTLLFRHPVLSTNIYK